MTNKEELQEPVWQYKEMLSSLAKKEGVEKLQVEYVLARMQEHYGSPVAQVNLAVRRAQEVQERKKGVN